MNLIKISTCLITLPVLACAACSHDSMPAPARTADSYASPVSAEPTAPSDGYAGPSAMNESAPSPATAAPSAAPRAEGRSASMSPPASAGALGGGRAYEAEKKADDRPGLGTSWGETRTSYVTNERFNRATPSNPFAVVALNYNDESGIQAMARRMGNGYASFDHTSTEGAAGAVSVRLLDENGNPLSSASFGGKDYVAGSDGQRYVIQIENHTGNRFEAVASVDGLDVIDGKTGSFANRGYLVNPWSTLEIDGFRRSQSAVAAFRFGAVKDSYAARKGSDRNVGVIGVAFFHEEGTSYPWTNRELDRRDSANPFPGGFASPPPPPLAR